MENGMNNNGMNNNGMNNNQMNNNGMNNNGMNNNVIDMSTNTVDTSMNTISPSINTVDTSMNTISPGINTVDTSMNTISPSINTVDTSMNTYTSQKGKSSKLPYILVALAVIVLGIALVYTFILNKPKNIFLSAINNEYKKLDKIIDDNVDSMYTEGAFMSNASLDFDINMDDSFLDENTKSLLDEINKLSLASNINGDYKNKELSLGFDAKYSDSSLFNVMLYGSKDSLYLELKNLFDKYIEIPVEDYESFFEVEENNFEDSKYIMDAIKNSILENMKDDDFKSTKAEISIGENKIKTKKITYSLTSENMLELILSVMKDLKEDEKFIKSLSTLSNEDKENIKDSIDEMIDSLNEAEVEEDGLVIELSVYAKGLLNEVVQYEFKALNNEEDANSAIVYSNYKGEKRLVLKEHENGFFTVVNKKSGDNKYNTTIDMDPIKAVINSEKKGDSWAHKYKVTMDESDVQVRGELINKTTGNDKQSTNEILFKLVLGLKDESDMLSLALTLKGDTKKVDSIDIPNLNNSVLYSQLTENDLNTIQSNIINNQTIVNFITKIMTVFNSSTEDDYNYDYDYDYDYSY